MWTNKFGTVALVVSTLAFTSGALAVDIEKAPGRAKYVACVDNCNAGKKLCASGFEKMGGGDYTACDRANAQCSDLCSVKNHEYTKWVEENWNK